MQLIIWVEARVQEEYLPLVRQSRTTEVALPGPSGQVFAAQLVSSAPPADAPSRAEIAVYSVANRRGVLAPGMPVDVRLPVSIDQADRPSCRIPSEAIFRDGNTSAVFVEIQSGIYQLRQVETGLIREGFTTVTKGLQPGDSVVIAGLAALRSKSK